MYKNVKQKAQKIFGKQKKKQFKYIGKVIEPEYCSFLSGFFEELTILERNDNLLFKVEARLSQSQLFCCCPTNTFEPIEFNVKGKTEEGLIVHTFESIYNEFCSKADKYNIQFPKFLNDDEKVLIISAAILIDYLWFENV